MAGGRSLLLRWYCWRHSGRCHDGVAVVSVAASVVAAYAYCMRAASSHRSRLTRGSWARGGSRRRSGCRADAQGTRLVCGRTGLGRSGAWGILLRHDNSSGRSSASATSLHRRPLPGAAHRAKVVAAMFNEARRRGALPPHLEMIVSVADKPRLSPPRAPRFGLPIFSWVTEYGLGSGNPAAWTGALPFPTWFNCGPTAPPWQRGSLGLPARGASSKVYGPSSSFEAGGAE